MWYYKGWEKVGNELNTIPYVTTLCVRFEERPDWEALASILRHLRRKIKLEVDGDYECQREEVQHFAQAIHGHPSIESFKTSDTFSLDSFDIIFSALRSLPVLESVTLWHRDWEHEEARLFPHPERMTELLVAPSLRVVAFDFFCFTSTLCQAMAEALRAGSKVARLRLNSCLFPQGGSVAIAHALEENSTLRTFEFFDNDMEEEFFSALAAALAVNTAIVDLAFRFSDKDSAALIAPVFQAMGRNGAVKTLLVDNVKMSGESLSTAIRNGLENNATLEKLVFYDIAFHDQVSVSWREALSFLQTNTHLKALTISVGGQLMDPHVAALCIDAVALLEENTALEILEIVSNGISPVDYCTVLSSLKGNSTLKTLHLSCSLDSEDGKRTSEAIKVVSAVKNNYGLESLGGRMENQVPGVGAVLRLNRAGRCYLVQDTSSILKGCTLLSAVSDDLDCLYLHLLENPSLCETWD